jgi:hypothetical protein
VAAPPKVPLASDATAVCTLKGEQAEWVALDERCFAERFAETLRSAVSAVTACRNDEAFLERSPSGCSDRL